MNPQRPENRSERRRDRSWKGARVAAAARARAPRPVATETWRDRINPAILGAGLGVLALVALLGWVVWDRQSAPPAPELDDSGSLPGVYYPDLGRGHLVGGTIYNGYNSDPPTSGPHDPVTAPWGIQTNPVPKEKLVHNMEHGGVLILYNCSDGCPEIVKELSRLTNEYLRDGKNIVMAPYPGMDSKIALVAWTRLDKFDAMDVNRVKRFVDVHERRFNPEGT